VKHTHPQDAEVINGLARIEGHVRAIKKMAEEGESCADILHQIAAVRAAMKRVAQNVMLGHLDHYLRDREGDPETRDLLADIRDTLTIYMRRSI